MTCFAHVFHAYDNAFATGIIIIAYGFLCFVVYAYFFSEKIRIVIINSLQFYFVNGINFIIYACI